MKEDLKKDITINQYFKENKINVALFMIITVLLSFIAPSKSFILQWIIDSTSKKAALFALLIGCLITLTSFLLELLSRNMFTKMSCTSISFIRNKVMEKTIRKTMEEYYQYDDSEIVSLLTNDIRIIYDDYFTSLYNIILYGGMLFFALCMFIYISPSMLIYVCIAGVAPILLPKIFSNKLKDKRNEFSNEMANYTSTIKELLGGFEVIRNFGVDKKFENKHEHSSKMASEKEYDFQGTMNLIISSSSFLSNVLFIIILLFGMFLFFDGKITLGNLVAATNLSNFVIAPCQAISQYYAKMKSSKSICNKIEKIMNKEIESIDNKSILLEDIETIKIENLRFSHNLELPSILNDINMNWDAGEKVVVTGVSGSGKSTIAKILYKYFEDYSGEININGIDLKDIGINDLNKSVGYMSQSSYLFNDTIRNNICLYQKFTDKEIDKAIDRAGVRDYINSLPKGLDSKIKENGKNLSGGQIQRIALARLVLRDYKAIIADEITANLDVETKEQILNNLLETDVMLFVITHDIYGDYMKKFNTRYDLHDGKLIKNNAIN